MADKKIYVTGASGAPFATADTDQAKDVLAAGGSVISADEAAALSSAQKTQAEVQQKYGTLGAAAAGAASGLTLGLAPGIATAMGLVDQDTMMALQNTGAFTAGDIAGTLAPALFTGGESLAARGALAGEELAGRGLMGTMMGLTPAGLMAGAGGLSERFAARFLPETGRIGQKALSMAARGATEGALINMGHTIGDNLVQNKPLAAESILASGMDGALFGGLLGGGLGAVSGVGSLVGEKLPGAVSGRIAGKELSATARYLGMTEDQILQAQSTEGGLKRVLDEYRKVLTDEGSGVTYGSRPAAIRETASRQGQIYKLQLDDAVQEASKIGGLSAAPAASRVIGRMETEILNPRVGSIGEKEARRFVGGIADEINVGLNSGEKVGGIPGKPRNLKPPKQPKKSGGEWAFKEDGEWRVGSKEEAFASYDSEMAKWKERVANQKGSSIQKERVSPVSSLEDWVKSRDMLDARIKSGKYTGMDAQMAKEALRIVDNEIDASLSGIDQKLADKFMASRAGLEMARSLEETVGKKAAQELLGHTATFTPRDLAVFGGQAALGHPGVGMAWMAVKGLGRHINKWIEPAMAESAYQASIGTKAAGATQNAQFKIGDSIRKFFRSSSAGTRKAAATGRAISKRETKKMDRASFEAAFTRAEQLISQQHQQRVSEALQGISNQGYEELAKHIGLTNMRAVQYLRSIMPPRRLANHMGSLRAYPKIHGMDMQEFKFLRATEGITSPFAILDKLEDGSASRDEVRAMKYVYPELHAEIVQESMRQIMEMKADGRYMPMDKIANLGIVLDSQIDTMLQPDRISAIQQSFAAPPGPKPSNPPEQPFTSQSLQTPIDAMG